MGAAPRRRPPHAAITILPDTWNHEISMEANRSVAASLGRTSWQGAGTLVGGGEIERRVAATGRRALGVGLFDEGVAQAGRAGDLGDPGLGLRAGGAGA